MKNILKYLGLGLGGLLMLALIMVLFVQFSSPPTFEEVPLPELAVATDSASVQAGKRLVQMNCAGCHLDPESGTLAGRWFGQNPLGEAHTANITRDAATGIAAYTDAELYRLLRTGVKRNHELALPFMPKLVSMSDEEVEDIIAFLRSDDPLLQPVEAERPIELSLLGKALVKFAWKPQPYQAARVKPPRGNAVAYGEYLVNSQLLCFACHSATHEVNLAAPPQTQGYLAGGTEFVEPGQEPVVSPSLRMPADGLGSWTEAQFITAMKEGVRPDGTSFLMPMEAYDELDTIEIRAIWAYLGSLGPAQIAGP
ncbi:MAG: cytochrome c [Bacteroidetes bacterium]|nr:MAG: cytochrome c [Bacteroidota bacterium]